MKKILIVMLLYLTLLTTNLFAGYIKVFKEAPKYIEKNTGIKITKMVKTISEELGSKIIKDKLKGKNKKIDIVFKIIEIIMLISSTIGLYAMLVFSYKK